MQLMCLLPAVVWILYVLLDRAVAREISTPACFCCPRLLDLGYYLADNLAIVLNQAGWTQRCRMCSKCRCRCRPSPYRPAFCLHLVFLLAMVVFLILRFTRARRREAWLAGEFEAARQVQQVLLPDKLDQCPGFKVECIYQPADEVGGDFFQQIATGRAAYCWWWATSAAKACQPP
jgi:hypothetical protein